MTQQLKLENNLSKPNEMEASGHKESDNLPIDVCKHLYGLMLKVTKNDDVTPEEVNSACNCAEAIVKFVKMNIEMEKMSK